MRRLQKHLYQEIVLVFILYLLALSFFLFFLPGRQNTYLQYNLIPFYNIRRFFHYTFVEQELSFFFWFSNIIGNLLLLLPLGLLLPMLLRRRIRVWRMLMVAILSSLLIEVLQILTSSGEFDVDDILLNVPGVMIGYVLCLRVRPFCTLFQELCRRRRSRQGKASSHE